MRRSVFVWVIMSKLFVKRTYWCSVEEFFHIQHHLNISRVKHVSEENNVHVQEFSPFLFLWKLATAWHILTHNKQLVGPAEMKPLSSDSVMPVWVMKAAKQQMEPVVRHKSQPVY